MAARIKTTLDEVVARFSDLQDPRSEINRKHPLASVIVIAVMAVLAGARGPTGIAAWAGSHEAFLLAGLDLPNGLPRKDVFRRVLMALKPAAFQKCFTAWLDSLRDLATAETGVDRPVLNVDGKTLRRSHDLKKGLGALHLVTVWATEYGLSLGQAACEEKSNEITAIPLVLTMVDIGGAVVTIDAMGTQKEIAATIIEGKGDYVLALKDNHPNLHRAVMDGIADACEAGRLEGKRSKLVVEGAGHGRVEKRTYYQMSAPKDLPGRDEWKGLKTIGLVVSECERGGKTTTEFRYFLSSLGTDVKEFARAVRSHWSIENSCHWTLDMTYREDESRARERNLRENLAWLNRVTLSLLKQHPDRMSIAMRRSVCGWNLDYLLQVLMTSAR